MAVASRERRHRHRAGSPATTRCTWHRKRMKGLEPSTFAMARRRSSQLSYIRRSPSIADTLMARSGSPGPRRRSDGGAPCALSTTSSNGSSSTAAPSPSGDLDVRTPITGEEIARVARTDAAGTDAAIARAPDAFAVWRDVPAPRRGELVRLLGEELRATKDALGALVTLEAGKIAQEGLGEVQEMIDICDFARRAVAPALRPHDRVGAAGPPHDRDLASARSGRRHQRVQLPGRRVELERGARARVRRPRRVEAVGEDAAHRARVPGAAAARRRALRRRARRAARARHRRRRPRASSSPTTRASRSSRRRARP